MGKTGLRHAARDRDPAAAQGTGSVRQPAPGDGAGAAGRCLHPEGGCGARPGPDDRARKHRRHLLRRTARRGNPARRPAARLRHRNLHHQRDRARGPRGVRTGPQAPKPRHQRGESQRHAVRPVLAQRRHGVACPGVPGRGADAHVCRQLRHAVGAQPAPVRCDRDVEHLRRPAVRSGVDADRQPGYAALRHAGGRAALWEAACAV